MNCIEEHPARFSRRGTLHRLAVGLAGTLGFRRDEILWSKEQPEGRKQPFRPAVVAFDVIETLFDLGPMRNRFQEAGLPSDSLGEWFAQMLRDALALSVSGVYRPFHEVARGTLEVFLSERGIEPTPRRLDAVLAGFRELPPHPDVQPAFQILRDAKVRIFTLTNGGATVTRQLLMRAGLADLVERTVTIDEVRCWKPAREVYLHCARMARVKPRQIALVATHDWDVQGAGRSGLVTGWVSRKDRHFHPAMDAPDVRGATLDAVASRLVGLPKG